MKNKIAIYAIGAVAAITAASCTEDREVMLTEGTVSVSTEITSDVEVVKSRAALDQSTINDLAATCHLWISNDKGLVRRWTGLSVVPSEITLMAGKYVAEAWAGDSVSASYDTKCYYGRVPFEVVGAQNTPVSLTCNISNVVASVEFAPSVSTALSDCEIVIGHRRGSLSYTLGGEHTRGYYMMPSTDPNLSWTMVGHDHQGNEIKREGVIENARKATEYAFSVKYTPSETPDVGGSYFDIEIDETEIRKECIVIIPIAPQIYGRGDFNIDEKTYCELGKISQKEVVVGASSYLEEVALSSTPSLSTLIPGFTGEELIITSTNHEQVNTALNSAGIYMQSIRDAEKQTENMIISFEPEFLNALQEGEYTFTLKATSGTGESAKATTKAFTIAVTDAAAAAEDVDVIDVWSSTAVIKGKILKTDATGFAFRYRQSGSSAWTAVTSDAVTVSEGYFTAVLTGLTPATKYEFTVDAQDFSGTTTKTFTTEGVPQIANAGFESWSKPGKVLLLYDESAGPMYWDSGNHGSATMNKNVTEQGTDLKHSGNYSAKLMSQFVGVGALGKFAAGNAFVGKYLNTDGTDGVLGFGRPHAARPTAVKVWVRYRTGAIDNVGKDWTSDIAAMGVVKGQTNDKGIIYVAMFDDSDQQTTENANGEYFPLVVKTKKGNNRKLFSKDLPNLIGYGEWTSDTDTEGENLIQVTIPIDYDSYKRAKASSLLIVCSASYWGDYFTGYNGATMWVDDIELVYDK